MLQRSGALVLGLVGIAVAASPLPVSAVEFFSGSEVVASPPLSSEVVVAQDVGLVSGGPVIVPWVPRCEGGPVSTCGPVATEPGAPPQYRICPRGTTCTCVPSCVGCDDCDAMVCVPASRPRCETACDCAPGLACVEGQCLAGFAPVYCCEGEVCSPGATCQSEGGAYRTCGSTCQAPEVWSCEDGIEACLPDRRCACTASCPDCEDCGPGTCVPRGAPSPYRCSEDGSCANPGDVCVCKSSCPLCDDCVESVCVPATCREDPRCEPLREEAAGRIDFFASHSNFCSQDTDCVKISTSTRCASTSGAWIHRRRAGWMRRVVERIDERFCEEAFELGCDPGRAGAPLAVPRCVEHRCTGLRVIHPWPLVPGGGSEGPHPPGR